MSTNCPYSGDRRKGKFYSEVRAPIFEFTPMLVEGIDAVTAMIGSESVENSNEVRIYHPVWGEGSISFVNGEIIPRYLNKTSEKHVPVSAESAAYLVFETLTRDFFREYFKEFEQSNPHYQALLESREYWKKSADSYKDLFDNIYTGYTTAGRVFEAFFSYYRSSGLLDQVSILAPNDNPSALSEALYYRYRRLILLLAGINEDNLGAINDSDLLYKLRNGFLFDESDDFTQFRGSCEELVEALRNKVPKISEKFLLRYNPIERSRRRNEYMLEGSDHRGIRRVSFKSLREEHIDPNGMLRYQTLGCPGQFLPIEMLFKCFTNLGFAIEQRRLAS